MGKLNVLYIVGLSRSGTTYLSKMLSEELHAVSIGESIKNIEIYSEEKELGRYRSENRKCTCGELPENCSFWSGLINNDSFRNDKDKFRSVLQKANELYGNALIIDTSKTTKRLEEYYLKELSEGNINLACVNLIRHCYGQINSYQKYHKKWKRKGIRSLVITDAVYWLYKNYSNINFFKRRDIPVLTVFYEDTIFKRDEFSLVVSEFVGNTLTGYSKHKPLMHEMSGNEGFKQRGMEKISYDSAWFYDKKLFWYSLLLWPMIIFNNRWYRRYRVDPEKP
ncbi:MAG: hypothetical protein H6963_10205 [Chromatiaceae bacterium]|nr:hypothetical protein [Chromatiaceae bacterium]MCP5409654.1 hypothetical protein [Chromatiaceae bacterium]MCP5442794.1 hypothetical protein [Chromatiaceae bacterium]